LAVVVLLVAAALMLPWRSGRSDPRRSDAWPTGWLLATLAISGVALAVAAPSLAVVTPGLPNDHYHAFLDPVVLVLVGTGAAALAQSGRLAVLDRPFAARRPLRPAAGLVLTVILAAISATAWPPAVSPDGGWRLADAAFKPDDAMRFPLARRGLALEPPVAAHAAAAAPPVGVVIVVCDPLFDDATGAPCGTLAEDRWLSDAYPPSTMQLIERFRAGSRRIVSIYAPSRLAAVPYLRTPAPARPAFAVPETRTCLRRAMP
jgi:hypothetical protein